MNQRMTRQLVYYGIFTSLGIALHIFESMLPNPFVAIVPGARIGLANMIGLTVLVMFGLKFALAVNLMRVIMAGLLSGAVTSIFYGFAGALVSTIMMWITLELLRQRLSLVGVSVVGALGHNVAQLCVAALMIQNPRIFMYLPFMMAASIVTGIFIGLTTHFLLARIGHYFVSQSYSLT